MTLRNRGQKKPKISDLSRATPTKEEIDELVGFMETDANLHPVTAAIWGASLVEHYLDEQLRRRLIRKDDDTWRALTTEIGPLSSFSKKIIMAYALRILTPDLKTNLEIVRVIRNAFAHSKKRIRFDNELVVKELGKAKEIPRERKMFRSYVKQNPSGPKHAYLSLCLLITCALSAVETNALRSSTARYKRIIAKAKAQMKVLENANALKLHPL